MKIILRVLKSFFFVKITKFCHFIFQPSDYGTMSQSCQSVPPLNLDEEYYDADDLNQEMSLRGIGIGVARFSDITIDERKDRIRNMVNEIYNSVPLSEGNHTRRSLNQNLKRFASVDNDIDRYITMPLKDRTIVWVLQFHEIIVHKHRCLLFRIYVFFFTQ